MRRSHAATLPPHFQGECTCTVADTARPEAVALRAMHRLAAMALRASLHGSAFGVYLSIMSWSRSMTVALTSDNATPLD